MVFLDLFDPNTLCSIQHLRSINCLLYLERIMTRKSSNKRSKTNCFLKTLFGILILKINYQIILWNLLFFKVVVQELLLLIHIQLPYGYLNLLLYLHQLLLLSYIKGISYRFVYRLRHHVLISLEHLLSHADQVVWLLSHVLSNLIIANIIYRVCSIRICRLIGWDLLRCYLVHQSLLHLAHGIKILILRSLPLTLYDLIYLVINILLHPHYLIRMSLVALKSVRWLGCLWCL